MAEPNISQPGRAARILFVDTGIDLAGGQVSLIEILANLDRSRFTPIVGAPAGSAVYARCKEIGVKCIAIPFESVHISTRRRHRIPAAARDIVCSLWGVVYLARIIRQHRVDIVHANGFKPALIGGVAAMLVSRPLVFHDRIQISHGLLEWLVSSLATRIVIVSRTVGLKHGDRSERKLKLVYDGVNLEHYSPTGRTAAAGTVGYLGRISEEKGLVHLVEAAPVILQEVPGARFLIGGTPFTPDDQGYLSRLTRRIRQLGLEANFEFLGHIEDAGAFIDRLSVFVLPSERESLGIALLEAMAMGKPVIASGHAGPGEIISDGTSGLLVPPGDSESLARAVVLLLTDQDLRARLGQAGRQRVVDDFSNTALANKTMELYDEMLAERDR